MARPICRSLTLAVASALAAACSADPAGSPVAPPASTTLATSRQRLPHSNAAAALAAVLSGNEQIVLSGPALVPPGAPLTPFIEARLDALGNVAIHDALNAIIPRFERYADTGPIDASANPAAAVLTAAHDAIVGAAPAAQSATDAWYASAIGALAGSQGVGAGVALGRRVAAAILARRANDGVAAGGVAPYIPGTNPGDYQFTFPFTLPQFDIFGTGGFADASIFAQTVTPFVISGPSQFRAPAPYGAATNSLAVLTAAYTADFNEVKALGCIGCTARSATQTEIARFWMASSVTGWNRIGGVVASQRNLDAWDAARLYAVIAIGIFDAYIVSGDSKYFYNFWRPVTAVELADSDNNPLTSSQAGWQVLEFPTPPVPDYPSAHATAGGAGAAIIEALVPGRGPSITTTSASLALVSRTFRSVAEAARENADSRVFIGYHFRHATDVGLAQGRQVGSYVATHALLPLHP